MFGIYLPLLLHIPNRNSVQLIKLMKRASRTSRHRHLGNRTSPDNYPNHPGQMFGFRFFPAPSQAGEDCEETTNQEPWWVSRGDVWSDSLSSQLSGKLRRKKCAMRSRKISKPQNCSTSEMCEMSQLSEKKKPTTAQHRHVEWFLCTSCPPSAPSRLHVWSDI